MLKIGLSGADAPPNTHGLKFMTADSTVKGLIISDRTNTGIFLNVGATGNQVTGNFIGTDTEGTHGLGNNIGVALTNATNNAIGGTTAATRNIISGNGVYGILIRFPESDRNRVQGNYIGTDVSGKLTLGNGDDGVSIQNDADKNTIGGATAAAGNIISGNAGDGVRVIFTLGTDSGRATGNRILSNSIYDNDELGIDLVHSNNLTEEVSPNDIDDNDAGPNNLQNFPNQTAARTGLRATTIRGTLHSSADTSFTIQFFSSPAHTADPSGNGEGKKFLGQIPVTTDESGNATFTFKTETKVPAGRVVTATATNQTTRDTSEFSNAVTVTSGS